MATAISTHTDTICANNYTNVMRFIDFTRCGSHKHLLFLGLVVIRCDAGLRCITSHNLVNETSFKINFVGSINQYISIQNRCTVSQATPQSLSIFAQCTALIRRSPPTTPSEFNEYKLIFYLALTK